MKRPLLFILVIFTFLPFCHKESRKFKEQKLRIINVEKYVHMEDPRAKQKPLIMVDGNYLKAQILPLTIDNKNDLYTVYLNDEVFLYALKGDIQIIFGGEGYTVKEKEFAFVPVRVPYKISSLTNKKCQVLFIMSGNNSQKIETSYIKKDKTGN
jgi:mannose-6-phosphate isomerase-like protein (cupin superfamily)